MDEIPTWHFLTGNAEELEPVWKAYHIDVMPMPDEKAVGHSPGVYLIDRTGQVRWYISTPFDEVGTPQWTPPLSDLLVKHIRERALVQLGRMLG
ncbi:MAG: SCO family protein [Anaerolineales bacterium]